MTDQVITYEWCDSILTAIGRTFFEFFRASTLPTRGCWLVLPGIEPAPLPFAVPLPLAPAGVVDWKGQDRSVTYTQKMGEKRSKTLEKTAEVM